MNSDTFHFEDERPDLSVIIPHFNQPEALEQALQDLLTQQGPSMEVFVVDDASQRRPDDVVQRFLDGGLPVTLLRQQQRRYTLAARLRGMAQARGRWLAFMDADDGLCSPTSYARAVEAANAASTDILQYVTLVDDGDGHMHAWRHTIPLHDAPLHGRDIFSRWLAQRCPAHSVWSKLYSRSLYTRILELEHDLPIFRIEDFYLTAHFLFFAQGYAACDIPVYRHAPPNDMHLEKTAARLIDAMRMYLALPERFAAWGLAADTAGKFRAQLRAMLTISGGRMCRLLPLTEEGEPDNSAMERIRRYGSAKDFFLALAIVNASNAKKLQDICGGLWSGSAAEQDTP